MVTMEILYTVQNIINIEWFLLRIFVENATRYFYSRYLKWKLVQIDEYVQNSQNS